MFKEIVLNNVAIHSCDITFTLHLAFKNTEQTTITLLALLDLYYFVCNAFYIWSRVSWLYPDPDIIQIKMNE